MLSLPVTTKALLSLTRFIMHFRAAAAKTAKLPFKYQQQNLWKFMKRCLNFTMICMVMKNAVLEQFKFFITLDIFSTAKIFSAFKKSINFYLKCHKIWMWYEAFARKKKANFFFEFPYMFSFLMLDLIVTPGGKMNLKVKRTHLSSRTWWCEYITTEAHQHTVY